MKLKDSKMGEQLITIRTAIWILSCLECIMYFKITRNEEDICHIDASDFPVCISACNLLINSG